MSRDSGIGIRDSAVCPPEVLAQIADLELVARIVVEGLVSGLHRSPFHGYSAEFQQHRPYRTGDDLKYLDWKLLARTDRLYSKQFRETTSMSAMIVLDTSISMAFPETGLSKLRFACIMAAALAWLDAERANLVAAVRAGAPGVLPALIADALRGYFHLRRYTADWLAVAEAGLAAARDTRAEAAAEHSLGTAYRSMGDLPTALRHYARALRMARGIDSGVLSVNSNSSVRVSTPFGGFKQSGFGRELGLHGLEGYSEVKNVYLATD